MSDELQEIASIEAVPDGMQFMLQLLPLSSSIDEVLDCVEFTRCA
jgi:hypothetical protein